MNIERALQIAVLYPAALVGHEAGDYITQTNDQACRKAAPGYNIHDDTPRWRSWLYNQAHCLTYHAALSASVAAACAATGIRLHPRRAAVALAASWLTHGLIDRRWPVKYVMKWTGSAGWYPTGAPQVDQTLHKIVLYLVILGATAPIARD